jgi:hypothetical protein
VPRNTPADSTRSAAKHHDAPARTPLRSASENRSRSTSPSSSPANLSVRTDRGRRSTKQVCEKWTLTFAEIKFPVIGLKFPVPPNNFPVILRRELLD